ncbi:hypothetical protein PWT90_05338 [Aphanocladium album]|nr:hypothetical protein PWT90_05338 [Aphanocladium album]
MGNGTPASLTAQPHAALSNLTRGAPLLARRSVIRGFGDEARGCTSLASGLCYSYSSRRVGWAEDPIAVNMKVFIITTTLLSALVAAASVAVEPAVEPAIEARKIAPNRGAAGHVVASLWSVAAVAVAATTMA